MVTRLTGRAGAEGVRGRSRGGVGRGMLKGVPESSSLHLYNTFAKKKEKFLPREKGRVSMYTCGPTVYGRPHIGNYSSFLMADLLCRWLTVEGYEVRQVKNITDVGHLVADQDEGEDKIEAQAKKEKLDPLEIARKYTEQYLEDEKLLNMLEPFARPRASETIPEMIAIISQLQEKGMAYETDDGVYFSVSSFPGYGKLSGNTLANLGKLDTGVRIELKESKIHPADFALWKKRVGEHEGHILHWDSPWGDGFPGWHIECSAMSSKFLGEQIDIHTGGEDNIFPHHECEIAQSEGANEKQFVRYWVHKRRVNFADVKMSKSLGNVLLLPDILEKGFSPLDLRYFLLSGHYRSHTQFTWKGLEDARKSRLKLLEWMEDVRERGSKAGKEGSTGFEERFRDAMNDDLNTPEAIAVIFEAMTWSRNNHQALQRFTEMVRETFGCFEGGEVAVPEEIKKLASEREKARKAGEYERSDSLRREILQKGFVLEDGKDGPKIVPKERRA
jgi:cysteinyl-tRNA synthetase